MAPNTPHAAKQAAKDRMAQTGVNYTTALRHVLGHSGAPNPPVPLAARAYLDEMLSHLSALGWGCDCPRLESGRYESYAGPAHLQVVRADTDGEQVDPDTTTALRLGAMAPPVTSNVGDLEFWAKPGTAPKRAAAQLDGELARVRLRRVHSGDQEDTVPCPICGDRYPQRQLLANCPGAPRTCPACILDGYQPYRLDLPYLAAAIDDLLGEDLGAPAGWEAVAALLALSCGSNLGERLTLELKARGGLPAVAERWHQPLTRSWIWLPPRAARHRALRHLGAGATVTALTAALEQHDPTLHSRARALCRDASVRWRPILLTCATAYATAFSTQAFERDRHRTPVHVVDSTGDGLSYLREPFAVAGNAENLERGLKVLLEQLLFPLLLGHGLRDEPDEPARRYGAGAGDTPAPRNRAHTAVGDRLGRAIQVATVLGRIPGLDDGRVPWDGPADGDAARFGDCRPATDAVCAQRAEARQRCAGMMYDYGGPRAMHADAAWRQEGWWIPADDAPHAVRQARGFLAHGLRVQVLWADPDAAVGEPRWVAAEVKDIDLDGVGPRFAPALRVWDGTALYGMRLADIALVLRSGPGAAPAAVPGPNRQ